MVRAEAALGRGDSLLRRVTGQRAAGTAACGGTRCGQHVRGSPRRAVPAFLWGAVAESAAAALPFPSLPARSGFVCGALPGGFRSAGCGLLSGVRFRRRNGCAEARSAVSAVNGCGFPPQRPLPGCGYFLPAARSDARTAGRSLPGHRISRKFCCEQSSICRNFLTFVRTNKQRRYGKNQRNDRGR